MSTVSTASRTVIKLGGSLLDLPDLHDRLTKLFQRLGHPEIAIVCGGGDCANLVRDWQPIHRLSERQAHDLAISAMRFNTELVRLILPGSGIVESLSAANRHWRAEPQRPVLLDPGTVLEEIASDRFSRQVSPLPIGWQTTSDAIACQIAIAWNCSDLVFAKSLDIVKTASIRASGIAGLIDPISTQLLGSTSRDSLRIRWCNLRSNPVSEVIDLAD